MSQAVVTEIAGSTSNIRLLELTVDNKTGYELTNPVRIDAGRSASPVVNTLAGTGVSGSTDGAARARRAWRPEMESGEDADGDFRHVDRLLFRSAH